MLEPNQKLIDEGNPCIILGGERYPIPPLAPKQNRVAVPVIKSFISRGLKESEEFLSGLDEAGMDDLIKIVFTALSAGHNITMPEFESMPMATIEMTRAVDTIMQQTGIFLPDAEKKIEKMKKPTA